MKASILLALLCFMVAPLPAAAERVVIDDFAQGLRPEWSVKEFKGQTSYTPVNIDGRPALHAAGCGVASGLVFKKNYRLQDYPLLFWSWKIRQTISGGDETKKSGDDFAARIYVVFPHWFFPKTRTISYVWGNRLSPGESVPSPYTGNAILLAVESGSSKAGAWQHAERNVLEDYRRLFGEEPPEVGAIAIMTDTDNTGTCAEAWYADLAIGRP